MKRLTMMLLVILLPFGFQHELSLQLPAAGDSRCSFASDPPMPCAGIQVALLDHCASQGLYGDGLCQPYCPELDPDCQGEEGGTQRDDDHDGLDDHYEERVVRDYLPFLSFHSQERCARSAILYRLRPHPQDSKLLHLTAVVLFEDDCGAKSHPGDNEAFGLTIDPSLPSPAGVLAIKAIAHQNTICEEVTTCGSCPGLPACQVVSDGQSQRPVVYYSRDKHGSYLSKEACDGSCFWTNWCELQPRPARLPLLNAGEPNAKLARDLTAGGLITREHGWSRQELFGFDPWGGSKFGEASSVTEDLSDDVLLTPTCPRPSSR